GTNNSGFEIALGGASGGNGFYTLSSAGVLNVTNEMVGFNGNGTFIQTSGTNTAGDVHIGLQPGSNGYFSLSGGSLSTPDFIVGDQATGTFMQSGGSAGSSTAAVAVGSAANGYYSLSSTGTLTAGSGGETPGESP